MQACPNCWLADTKRGGSVASIKTLPSTQHEDVLLVPGELPQEGQERVHGALGVESLGKLVSEVARRFERGQAPEHLRIATPCSALIVGDVYRDPEQPREKARRMNRNVAPAPRFHEDHRRQILRNAPVRGSPKAKRVDAVGVPIEQFGKRVSVVSTNATPELKVGHRLHTRLVS
jgi:hypothetical protein